MEVGPGLTPTADVATLSAASKVDGVDAPTALAVAHTTNDPSQALESAQAAAAVGRAAKTAHALSEHTEPEQQAIHATLTAAVGGQDKAGQLAGVGYEPPPTPAQRAAKLNTFEQQAQGHPMSAPQAVGAALQTVAPVGRVIEKAPVVGPIASKLGAGVGVLTQGPYNQLTHAYRMFDLLSRQQDPGHDEGGVLNQIVGSLENPGKTAALWKYDLSPSRWAKAWKSTANGATSFDPQVARTLQAKWGTVRYKIMTEVAGGTDPAVIAQNMSKINPSYGPIVDSMVKSPVFQADLKVLQNSTSSIGRGLVGEQMLNTHPQIASDISGATDALAQWYMNPLVLGGKMRDAQQLSRYALDSNDVQTMYRTDGNVRRAMDATAKAYNEGGAAGVIRVFPELSKIADELSTRANAIDGPLKGEDIAKWLSGVQGTTALLAGRAGNYFHATTMVPHLNAIQAALKDGRVALGRKIDWLADDMPTIVKKIAPGYEADAERQALRIPSLTQSAAVRLRRMTSLVPTSNIITDGDPNSLQNIRRLARVFLPAKRADEITNSYALGDNRTRYQVIRGLASEIFNAVDGGRDNPYLASYAEQWLKSYDEEWDKGQHYLAHGDDSIALSDTEKMPGAINELDAAKAWKLPDWRRVTDLSKRSGVQGVIGAPLGSLADAALRDWRVTILARPGFVLRAGPEELANFIARNGVAPLVKSYAARSALDIGQSRNLSKLSRPLRAVVEKFWNEGLYREIKAEERRGVPEEESTLPPADSFISTEPMKEIAAYMKERIPASVLSKITTPAELIAAWAAFPWRVVKAGERAVSGSAFLDDMKLMAEHGGLGDAFTEWVSSLHAPESGFGDETAAMTDWARAGHGSSTIELKPGSNWVLSSRSDPFYHEKWASRLNYLRRSKLIQAAWSKAGDKRSQLAAVRAVLKSDDPDINEARKMIARAQRMPDGRMIGKEVSQREIDDAWAAKVVEQANEAIFSPAAKKPIRWGQTTLAKRLLADRIDARSLRSIPEKHTPEGVLAREVIPTAQSPLQRFLSSSMETMVGKPMDWLSRQPIYQANYHFAAQEARRNLARFGSEMDPQSFGKLVNDVAQERAVNESLPYIHDVRSRTQFEMLHRRLAPFLFAQRQFYTRWTKAFRHSPQALARFSQIMNGLRVSGFVKTDPSDGQAYFVYPGSGAFLSLATRALSALGISSFVPVPSSFTGEVRYLTPGLTGITPSASPMLTVPMDALASIFPQLTPTAETFNQGVPLDSNPNKLADILGNTAGGLAPTVVSRTVSALYGSMTGRGEIATEVMNAMAYLEASGHGLPDNATAAQRATYISRLQTWATETMMLRAAFGFVMPSSPTLNTDKLGLDKEYQSLLNHLPYDQALLAFKTAYPDGVPYTIGKTAAVGGGELPTTPAGLKFLNQNMKTLQKYPDAAPWLIPQSTQTGPYDANAESEQLLLGLRQQRTPEQWYEQLVNARDATTYYDHEQAYLNALNNPNGGDTTQTQQAWVTWSSNYLRSHPGFAQVKTQLSNEDQQRRTEVIRELGQALADPALPKNPTTTSIGTMLKVYDEYQGLISDYTNGSTTISSDRSNLWNVTNNFVNWGNSWANSHPEAKPFWSSVLQYSVQW